MTHFEEYDAGGLITLYQVYSKHDPERAEIIRAELVRRGLDTDIITVL
jgi:hypothetical protein